MIDRILSLISQWRAFRSYRPLLAYPDEIPEWTRGDAESLAGYLNGSVGRKLITMMRRDHAAIMHRCCVESNGLSPDVAKGYWMAYANFVSMSMKSAEDNPGHEQEFNDELEARLASVQ